jgi:syringomycin synthetase protein SyrE
VEQLVAFLARDTATPLSIAALRARLSAALPDYMVPRRFVGLDALPRTPTGKVDRKALPAAPTAHRDLETAPAEPRSALETKLVALWSDVLGIDTVGIDDDFLALGGDSLGAVQIANRVVRDFGVEVPLAALLAKPTVAAMAALIESDGAGAAPRPRMPAIRPRNR